MKQKIKAEERILRAATPIFAEHGLQGATVRQICDAAQVNVAAINYYFRSKELLYREVHMRLFENLFRPLMTLADGVHDAASWRSALETCIRAMMDFATRDDAPYGWAAMLFAHERTNPTEIFPFLMEHMYEPLSRSLKRLIGLALAPDATEVELRRWSDSIFGQVNHFIHRRGPWAERIIPTGCSREEWREGMIRHILEGVTCRLSFRRAAG